MVRVDISQLACDNNELKSAGARGNCRVVWLIKLNCQSATRQAEPQCDHQTWATTMNDPKTSSQWVCYRAQTAGSGISLSLFFPQPRPDHRHGRALKRARMS